MLFGSVVRVRSGTGCDGLAARMHRFGAMSCALLLLLLRRVSAGTRRRHSMSPGAGTAGAQFVWDTCSSGWAVSHAMWSRRPSLASPTDSVTGLICSRWERCQWPWITRRGCVWSTAWASSRRICAIACWVSNGMSSHASFDVAHLCGSVVGEQNVEGSAVIDVDIGCESVQFVRGGGFFGPAPAAHRPVAAVR